MRETKLSDVETVVQEFVQLAAFPQLEQIFSDQNEAVTEATSQAEGGNGNIVSDAEPTENEHVVANELGAINQPVIQEIVVTETFKETVQKTSDLPKKATVDGQKIMDECNKSGKTNPDPEVASGPEKNGQGSEGSMDEDSLPGNEGNLNFPH